MTASLVLSFEDRAALEREHTENFAHGRAFVPGTHDVALLAPCLFTLVHPETGDACEIAARVVMVLADGVALEFTERSDEARERIRAFIHTSAHPAHGANDDGLDLLEGLASEDDELAAPHNPVRDRQLRLRNLPVGERLRVARGTNMEERVLLERIYGTAVWEPLLRNPKITVPEVARIAKKGTVPRPLLELICDNEAWIHQSLVRRALLTNPRLPHDAAMRVLRTLPARELKLVPHQTAYPQTVRSAAARLIRT